MIVPITWIGPMWLHNRRVVVNRQTGEPFVLRRLRLGSTPAESTVDLIPVSACGPEGLLRCPAPRAEWEALARSVTCERLLVDYDETSRVLSVLSAPL